MSALLWWSGITMDTPMGDIGWSYVAIFVGLVVVTRCLWVLLNVGDKW